MSYAMSRGLQAAVFQRLIADPVLTGLVGDAVYDAVPPGEVSANYVVLGDEDVRDMSHQTGMAAEYRFLVSAVTTAAGFDQSKRIAEAVCDALIDASLPLERGRVVALKFFRARTRRLRAGRVRRVDLTFRAIVHDD